MRSFRTRSPASATCRNIRDAKRRHDNFFDEIMQLPAVREGTCIAPKRKAEDFLFIAMQAYDNTGDAGFHRVSEPVTKEQTCSSDLVIGREIEGEATIELGFRGTMGLTYVEQWLLGQGNFNIGKAHMQNMNGQVHDGFLQTYVELKHSVSAYLESCLHWAKTVRLSGHSRGGALALLFATHLARQHPEKNVDLVTWAAPRAVDCEFVDCCNALKNLRVVQFANVLDLVPMSPPQKLDFHHIVDPTFLDTMFSTGTVVYLTSDVVEMNLQGPHDIERYHENFKAYFLDPSTVCKSRGLKCARRLLSRFFGHKDASPAHTFEILKRQGEATQILLRSQCDVFNEKIDMMAKNILKEMDRDKVRTLNAAKKHFQFQLGLCKDSTCSQACDIAASKLLSCAFELKELLCDRSNDPDLQRQLVDDIVSALDVWLHGRLQVGFMPSPSQESMAESLLQLQQLITEVLELVATRMRTEAELFVGLPSFESLQITWDLARAISPGGSINDAKKMIALSPLVDLVCLAGERHWLRLAKQLLQRSRDDCLAGVAEEAACHMWHVHEEWVRVEGIPEHEPPPIYLEKVLVYNRSLYGIKRLCELNPDCLGFTFYQGVIFNQWFPKGISSKFNPTTASYTQKYPFETWEFYYMKSRMQKCRRLEAQGRLLGSHYLCLTHR